MPAQQAHHLQYSILILFLLVNAYNLKGKRIGAEYRHDPSFIQSNNVGPEGEIKYNNDKMKRMVEKYNLQTNTRRGRQNTNRKYNKAFSAIINRMIATQEKYEFVYEPDTPVGEVYYDGKKVVILINDPGDSFGTEIGSEGILFEEIKHVEQFLDGKTYFMKDNEGKWGVRTNIENEVEAKIFAASQLKYISTYDEENNGKKYRAPTQLGYLMSCNSDRCRIYFLKTKVQLMIPEVTDAGGQFGSEVSVSIGGYYPDLPVGTVKNTFSGKIKNDSIFVYPRK